VRDVWNGAEIAGSIHPDELTKQTFNPGLNASRDTHMRAFLATSFIVFSSTAAFAQKVGDRIVVTAEDAKLKSQNEIVGSVRRGSFLTVEDLNGDWSWVTYTNGKETLKGWINRRDVVPFEKALDFFNDAVRRNPNAEFYTIRGAIWAEKKEYDKAIADFNEAIRLDPKNASAQSARDLARHQKSELDKATANHGQAMRRDPKWAVSYYNRGLAWHKRGDFDKAIADFNQAIRFDPNHAGAYSARGDAWQSKGDIDKAISDYNEAIRLDPKQAAARGHRGIALHKQGNYDKARADWNEAIRLDPKDLHSHFALAWLLATCPDAKIRDGKRAVELATDACEFSGWKNAYAVGALAAAYAESGDFVNAVKWQEEFLRLCSEGEKKKWGFLLELYKSGKPFREGRGRQEFRFGGDGRFSIEYVA
jgi:tetratricopeptide (TPR) repeat protein